MVLSGCVIKAAQGMNTGRSFSGSAYQWLQNQPAKVHDPSVNRYKFCESFCFLSEQNPAVLSIEHVPKVS